MSRKGKFDLASLVHSGYISDGETIYFVSDPSKTGAVSKQPNGDYKLDCEGQTLSIHAAAQRFLGTEPPNHASQWLRTGNGKTLYQLWQTENEQ